MLRFSSYEDRLKYLMLESFVGLETFGSKRYLNQWFYSSPEWKRVRNQVIIRDGGCDLALPGYDVPKFAYVHHICPITNEDLIDRNPLVLDPNNLVLVSRRTHELIHYGNLEDALDFIVERKPGDTKLW